MFGTTMEDKSWDDESDFLPVESHWSAVYLALGAQQLQFVFNGKEDKMALKKGHKEPHWAWETQTVQFSRVPEAAVSVYQLSLPFFL